MENFAKKLQGRQFTLIGGLLGAFSAVMLTRNIKKEPIAPERLQGFIDGFQLGILGALLGALVFFLIRNFMAMRNAERLKKLYISETDERKIFIMQKSGSKGMSFAMYGLAVGTAVAGNINNTVFFSLLGSCLFVSLIRGFFKIYYRNKY